MLLRIFRDGLTRGFILTTLILLGVGLEQGLLNRTPSQNLTIWFLCGNILGLPIGAYLWGRLYPATLFPLYFWLLEGIAIVTAAWRPIGPVFLISGLIFGILILHLFLLGKSRSLSSLIHRVGIAIITGNILLALFEKLPWPLGLAWLAIALAGWRITRPPPEATLSEPTLKGAISLLDENTRRLSWFWLFFLCFYTLGGLYYSILDQAQGLPSQSIFDLVSLALYVLGILLVIFTPRYLLRYTPYLAVALMGLSIIIQISPETRSLYAYPLMDIGFGIMDCLSISVILAFSQNLTQATLGLSIFPVSIVFGLLISQNITQNLFKDYQWALAVLFLTIIPLGFAARLLKKTQKEDTSATLLALPPATNTSEKVTDPPLLEFSASNNPLRPVLSNTDQVNLLRIATTLGLSDREKEVFMELVQNKKLKEIAEDLGLAIGTIKALCNRIYEKAGVKGKKELLKKLYK